MYTTDLHKNSYKNILNSKHLQKLIGDVLIFVQINTKFNCDFFKLQPPKKKLILLFVIINLLVIRIIFAKETMGPSVTSAALGSSQEFASRVKKMFKCS